MFDILSIGDATLDTFVRLVEASVMCSQDRENCLLCLSYADKIPIEGLEQQIAGNAANNAVGSARLGLKAAFYSIVGDDETGNWIVRTMRKEKVSSKYVQVDKGKPSNYSVVLNYKGERTILVYHYPRSYRLPKFTEPASWIYFTSLGKNHDLVTKQLTAYVKKNGAKLGFNPGTHQLKRGIIKLRPVFEQTTALFLNKEEAELLVGRLGPVKNLLLALRNFGPKIVVITDGARGSFTFDGKFFYEMGVYPVKVVEKTGAGDAFATGFLAATIKGLPITEAIRWGAANSASVITKVGPQPGLLNASGMKAFLRRHGQIKPKIV